MNSTSTPSNAVFFLSTGRCGTQWLHEVLSAVFADRAVVTHEPHRGAYPARRYLRAPDRLRELLSTEEFSEHISSIRETLHSKSYTETGWPSYPVLPLFIENLPGRVRIVHLVRHPVPVALSLVTHNVYGERNDWVAGAAITPFDHGTLQKDLADRWSVMTAYEKCIFWWTEINLYALELAKLHPDVEFKLIRYEELFDPAATALEELIQFMNLGDRAPLLRAMGEERVDRYRWKTDTVDWRLIFNYPRTIALAGKLGYDVKSLSSDEIAARYFAI